MSKADEAYDRMKGKADQAAAQRADAIRKGVPFRDRPEAHRLSGEQQRKDYRRAEDAYHRANDRAAKKK